MKKKNIGKILVCCGLPGTLPQSKQECHKFMQVLLKNLRVTGHSGEKKPYITVKGNTEKDGLLIKPENNFLKLEDFFL